jgi:hypothetical protein
MIQGTPDPTPYPDLNAVLDDLVAGVRAILAGNFVGAYLQGSFAVGDFDEHSDVDFVVVAEDELSDGEVTALQVMHPRIYGLACPWAQHLEGSYYPRAVLKDAAQRGRDLWYLDHGSQSLERSTHCNSVVVRWTLRHYGVVLAGPIPDTLVDPIPADVLRDEIAATLRDWGRVILAEPERFANRFYQGFIVLSYCRMLRDLVVGDTGSKRTGAEWAKANLDPAWADLIDRAWACRPDPFHSVRTAADPADFARTLDFVSYAIRTCEGPCAHAATAVSDAAGMECVTAALPD